MMRELFQPFCGLIIPKLATGRRRRQWYLTQVLER